MERLGTVHRIVGNLLILRAASPDPAPIGTMAIDEHLDTIGRVVDVFGPVDDPFLAVSPDGPKTNPSMVGNPLYWRSDD